MSKCEYINGRPYQMKNMCISIIIANEKLKKNKNVSILQITYECFLNDETGLVKEDKRMNETITKFVN